MVYLFFEPGSLRLSESPNEPSISTLAADSIAKKKTKWENNCFFLGGGGVDRVMERNKIYKYHHANCFLLYIYSTKYGWTYVKRNREMCPNWLVSFFFYYITSLLSNFDGSNFILTTKILGSSLGSTIHFLLLFIHDRLKWNHL